MADFNLIKIESKPLEKLIEVIGKGIVQFYKPIAIKKEAKAEAYKIEILEIPKLKALIKRKDIEQDIIDRIEERVLHREFRNQKNLDSINLIAEQELHTETEVSNEEVDKDWINRFFNYAQEISNEGMQKLWGKILAGEVKSPGSYSMRTLGVLRNLTKREAEIFLKFAQLSIKGQDSSFILNPNDYLKDKFGILITDKLIMEEVGLMSTDDIYIKIKKADSNSKEVYIYGKKLILVEREENAELQTLPIIAFTVTGKQLLKLIKITFNENYVQKFAELLKNPKVKVGYAEIKSKENKGYTYSEPLVDITVK